MFNKFSKKKKVSQYLVWKMEKGCEDVYDVARFSQKEDAEEYCEIMNRKDKDFEYFYF